MKNVPARRLYLHKYTKKALLVLNNYKNAINATNKFIEIIKNDSSNCKIHVLYIDPDCSELHPDAGVCFWMPYRELNEELIKIRHQIMNEVIDLLDQLHVKPVVYIEGTNAKDKIIDNHIRTKGPYDLVVVSDNNSKLCRESYKMQFVKDRVPDAAKVVCLL